MGFGVFDPQNYLNVIIQTFRSHFFPKWISKEIWQVSELNIHNNNLSPTSNKFFLWFLAFWYFCFLIGINGKFTGSFHTPWMLNSKKACWFCSSVFQCFPGGASGKEPTCQCSRCKRCRFDPCIVKSPWRRKWQSALVFLPGKSHGQMSVTGYSPWSWKESDTIEHERACTHTHTHTHTHCCPLHT